MFGEEAHAWLGSVRLRPSLFSNRFCFDVTVRKSGFYSASTSFDSSTILSKHVLPVNG